MNVTLHGSNHLDPEVENVVSALGSDTDYLAVEGMTEEEDKILDAHIPDDIELNTGLDIDEDHVFEDRAADRVGENVMYLDSGLEMEQYAQGLIQYTDLLQISPHTFRTGIDERTLPLLAGTPLWQNPSLAYDAYRGEVDISPGSAYRLFLEEAFQAQGKEVNKADKRVLDGYADLVDANYKTWDRVLLDFIEQFISDSPFQQKREQHWLKKVDNISADVDEIDIIAGIGHTYPAPDNLYGKLKDAGFSVQTQPLRRPAESYQNEFLFKQHQ